jgi:Holliday junction resolvase
MINSLKKGKRGEREFVQFCKKHGFLEARRGQQYSGIEGEDIVGLPLSMLRGRSTEKKKI